MTITRFSHFASAQPNAVAIIDPGGRAWRRGEVAIAANRLSHALLSLGGGPGEVLAIVAPNCAEYMVAYLAATQIGMYFVPLATHLAPEEIEYIIEDCKPRTLLIHEKFKARLSPVLAKLDPKSLVWLPAGLNSGLAPSDARCEPPTGYIEGRMLAYTSATSGRPKGVILPLESAGYALDKAIKRRIANGIGLERGVLLCASMLYHGAPLEGVAIALHMGHTVILMGAVTPEGVLRLIHEHRVTNLYAVPTLFGRLLRLDATTRARYATDSLVHVTHLGISCPVEIKRQMIEWWGPIFSEMYGATEGQGTIASSHEWLNFPGTVGRPIPGSEIVILDDIGEEVPRGTVGTIYMTRHTGDRFEYLRDPEKTRAAYRGKFFTVGDVGYLNSEGYLFLCGRKIDMINVSGMKIYPAEIESVLALHPHVADCAVLSVPDEITGEAALAFIKPADSSPPAAELKSDLIRFLQAHLSALKIPRFEIAPDLARDATGKLRKTQLRDGYLSKLHQD